MTKVGDICTACGLPWLPGMNGTFYHHCKFASEKAVADLRKENEFLWRWIDRIARDSVPLDQCLSAITHRPGAPEWVKRCGINQG